jgi:hypothetical protein
MIDLPKIFSWKMAFWILKLKGTETHKIIPDRKIDWIGLDWLLSGLQWIVLK